MTSAFLWAAVHVVLLHPELIKEKAVGRGIYAGENAANL